MKYLSWIAAFILSTTAYANEEMHRLALVDLPHPMHLLIEHSDELDINATQHQAIEKMMQHVPSTMRPMMQEAKTREKAIIHAVMQEHQSSDNPQLIKQLDELASLKRRISITHIGALNKLQNTLSPAQYQKLLQMLY